MTNPNIKSLFNRYQNTKIKEQTKIREILQQTALLGLQRHNFFEKAAFYGGTALRILYGLDRFSEDLDFTLLQPNPTFDFTPFLEDMKNELSSFGFTLEVNKKTKNIESNIVSAFMKINTIQLYLIIGEETKNIIHNEKIHIKLEVDIDPPLHFRTENHLVLNPFPFYVLTLHKSDLFAGKMHAILNRNWKGRIKGRDWYDLIWYIQNNIPLSLTYLESCMKQAEQLNSKDSLSKDNVLNLLEKKIQTIDWDAAKADVRAFIADPQKIEIWSPQFFLDLILHLQTENEKNSQT